MKLKFTNSINKSLNALSLSDLIIFRINNLKNHYFTYKK